MLESRSLYSNFWCGITPQAGDLVEGAGGLCEWCPPGPPAPVSGAAGVLPVLWAFPSAAVAFF